MQGDFSVAKFDPALHTRGVADPALGPLRNVAGVLQQQGRVMLDADLAEGELLDLAWQGQAGRDVIGAGVCAVPAAEPDGFEVVSAVVDTGRVLVTLRPGRAWVDGILTRLVGSADDPAAPLEREAAYFGLPWSVPAPTPASIGNGVRDAVVLEVSEESLHAFQYPEQLLEAALGGVDTATRAYVNCRLRLLRLAAGEDCASVVTRLRDDPAAKGHLSVSLQPPQLIPGDCPVVAGGGYTGFEHHLYRIEIAEQDAGAPARFKWSPWNGGLVGRGRFDASTNPDRVLIDAGRAAIVHSGLNAFYLEALQYDTLRGAWRVVYATQATLNAEQDLELAAPAAFGTLPSTADPVFFRLWNGIADIADFTDTVTPNELRDGIRLVFDAPADGKYRPGDYWSFDVRAGDVANPQQLLDDAPPRGILYHRVPLAEIHWTDAADTTVSGTLEDCRKRFRPLTNQKICCTFLIGDGVTSFGDFNSLEQAAEHLPRNGGELCLLPGMHRANLHLQGRKNVRIHGCRWHTTVMPRDTQRDKPLLHIEDCYNVEIFDLDLITLDATAVLIDGRRAGGCREITLRDCRMVARHNVVRADRVEALRIADNRMHLMDTADGLAMISLLGEDALIERNTLVLTNYIVIQTPGNPAQPGNDPTLNPDDPCARPELIYAIPALILGYVHAAWAVLPAQIVVVQPYRARGGIHLRAGCERVTVRENRIVGGAGDGIVLGGDIDPPPPPVAVDQPAPVAVVVTAAGNADEGEFLAFVTDERDAPLPGVDLYLENDKAVSTDRSDEDGLLAIKTKMGHYRIKPAPGYKVVAVLESLRDERLVHIVKLAAAPGQIGQEQRWLHEIALNDNDIAAMGLSGIGFGLRRGALIQRPPVPPPTTPREALLALVDASLTDVALTQLLAACSPVRDLQICGNRLHGNLRNTFDDVMREQAQVFGRGGISLGMVESLVIRANHIEGNGVSAVDPVCGVFVAWGNDTEIVDNAIRDNGIVDERYERDRRAGLRGGLYIAFAGVQSNQLSLSTGRKPALRVHDNRVDQPAGRALTAYAFGPVSVANNHFNSEYSGLFGLADAFVGGVLLFNFGGMHRLLLRLAGVYVAHTGSAVPKRKAFRAPINFRRDAESLPGGETLFNDNYVRIGSTNRGIVSQVVASLDDLGYANNTGAVYRGDRFFGNALLLGDTLRATASRLREDISRGLSIVSYGILMNLTAHNQGDHCIVAYPDTPASALLPTISYPNQVLDLELCSRLQEFSVLWEYLIWVLAAQADLFGGELTVDVLSPEEREQMPSLMLGAALQYVQSNKAVLMQRQQEEAYVLSLKHGEDYPAAKALAMEVEANAVTVHLVGQGAETFPIATDAAPDEGGATLSGRLANDRGQGIPRATMEFTRRNGTLVEAIAITDAKGHFSARFDAGQTRRLEQEGELFLRAVTARGSEILRDTNALKVRAGSRLRVALRVPLRLVPRADAASARPIFGQVAPATPPANPPPTTVTSTPLERLQLDAAVLKRLRAAGIADVEALAATPQADLARVLGDEAAAKELIARAKRLLRSGGVADTPGATASGAGQPETATPAGAAGAAEAAERAISAAVPAEASDASAAAAGYDAAVAAGSEASAATATAAPAEPAASAPAADTPAPRKGKGKGGKAQKPRSGGGKKKR